MPCKNDASWCICGTNSKFNNNNKQKKNKRIRCGHGPSVSHLIARYITDNHYIFVCQLASDPYYYIILFSAISSQNPSIQYVE